MFKLIFVLLFLFSAAAHSDDFTYGDTFDVAQRAGSIGSSARTYTDSFNFNYYYYIYYTDTIGSGTKTLSVQWDPNTQRIQTNQTTTTYTGGYFAADLVKVTCSAAGVNCQTDSTTPTNWTEVPDLKYYNNKPDVVPLALPEPEEYVMMLLGLPLIPWVATRRKLQLQAA